MGAENLMHIPENLRITPSLFLLNITNELIRTYHLKKLN